MSDIKTDLYKKAVEAAVDRWKGKLVNIGAKADKIRSDNPKAGDKDFAELDKAVANATLELKLDIVTLDVPKEAPKSELDKLPDWLKVMIKAKGVPLGKGVSIAPSVDFDFKNFKLKSLGVTVHW